MQHTVPEAHCLLVCFLERNRPQHYTFFLRLMEVYVCVCVYACVSSLGSPGVWSIKGLTGSVFHIVSSSGPLNSVGLVYEREGRCSTFHLQSRGALCSFFIFKLQLPTALIILPPVSTLFLCSVCCWKLLWATLTLGVFTEKRTGWYPDVNVCFLPWLFKGISICVCVRIVNVYCSPSVWLRSDCVAWSRKIWALLQVGPLSVHPSVWLIVFYWWRKRKVGLATFCCSDISRLI